MYGTGIEKVSRIKCLVYIIKCQEVSVNLAKKKHFEIIIIYFVIIFTKNKKL